MNRLLFLAIHLLHVVGLPNTMELIESDEFFDKLANIEALHDTILEFLDHRLNRFKTNTSRAKKIIFLQLYLSFHLQRLYKLAVVRYPYLKQQEEILDDYIRSLLEKFDNLGWTTVTKGGCKPK